MVYHHRNNYVEVYMIVLTLSFTIELKNQGFFSTLSYNLQYIYNASLFFHIRKYLFAIIKQKCKTELTFKLVS